jgi:acetyltransferase-like isoleucine patch superfamily enzyme
MIRDALVFIAVVLTVPLWIGSRLMLNLGSERFFCTCSEILSMVPGLPGIFLRRGFYARALCECSTDCQIGFGTTFSHADVVIEPHVVIGNRCSIGCAVLRDGVALGSNIDILSGRYQHPVEGGDAPVQFRAGTFRRTEIGRSAWVGNSSVIMADVGAGCVIGAGSVVVTAIPAATVAAGNPAVVKKCKAA